MCNERIKKGIYMRKLSKLCLITTFFAFVSTQTNSPIVTFFNNRSVSRNAARDLAGWTNYIHQDSSRDVVYGAFSITPEYSQSFNSHTIASALFGNNLIKNNCSSHLKISGSQVNNRSPHDLLADYFYLPSDFESTVHFKPTIDNFIIDLGFYLGLDAWAKGLYFWVHVPFDHTRWDLNITENVINPGVNNYVPGTFTPTTLNRGKLLNNFTEFVNGKQILETDAIIFEQLKFAYMSQDRLIKSRVAEIRTAIGWDFFTEYNYHAGFNGQVVFPTGLRPKGEFLFEPIVGNAHFWELGVGLNAHYTFWRNHDETRQLTAYTDINITHLFKTRQARTFDLISAGQLSRYMLAMELISPSTNLLAEGTPAIAQFNNTFLPVANITALNVNVDIAVQADIVFMLNFTSNNWSYDIGYNYWGRSCENITLQPIDSFTEHLYALKGDAQIFGFESGTTNAVALSATESRATIHSGTNFPATGTTNPIEIHNALLNPHIDFPKKATTSTTPPVPLQYAPNNTVPADQINTSNPPVFITMNDVNTTCSGSRGSSSKLFTHFSYTWSDKKELEPYIGFGGEVEFAHTSNHKKNTCNNGTCPSASASQWGLWLKTGATFN